MLTVFFFTIVKRFFYSIEKFWKQSLLFCFKMLRVKCNRKIYVYRICIIARMLLKKYTTLGIADTSFQICARSFVSERVEAARIDLWRRLRVQAVAVKDRFALFRRYSFAFCRWARRRMTSPALFFFCSIPDSITRVQPH